MAVVREQSKAVHLKLMLFRSLAEEPEKRQVFVYVGKDASSVVAAEPDVDGVVRRDESGPRFSRHPMLSARVLRSCVTNAGRF